MILKTLFSISLLFTGGHVIDTKLGLHHYDDENYKEIFYLKNKDTISKNCVRHSENEDIKKIRGYRHTEEGTETVTYFKVTKNEEKDSLQETSEEKITS